MKKSKTTKRLEADSSSAKRSRLLTQGSPFAIKEAYVKLRTNMMFCMTEDGSRACKTFGITSSSPSEGKSLTAANVAISCAMLGKSTLLIDADLRKPMQKRLWKADIRHGLSDYLAQIAPMEIMKIEQMPLWVLCAGMTPPNPSEMLASDRMKSFLKEYSALFDYMIIDTPPINTVADAKIISSLADGMLVVAKSGVTTVDELNEALESVRSAGGNLCGVVLNELDSKTVKQSYHSRYGNYYSKKYGYYSSGYGSK